MPLPSSASNQKKRGDQAQPSDVGTTIRDVSQISRVTEEGKELPWWENNLVVVSLILGLPVVGLLSNGVLSSLGFNTSEFPAMFSTELFMTDLFLRLLSLPVGVLLIRALMRRMDIE